MHHAAEVCLETYFVFTRGLDSISVLPLASGCASPLASSIDNPAHVSE